MIKAHGYAGFDAKSPLQPLNFDRRELNRNDVLIKISYCGICHSDIHSVRSEWGKANYPLVPGHEIIGEVIKVGASATKHQIGDLVGVGCLVNSCGSCEQCTNNKEQLCHQGATATYGSIESNGNVTQGGYSNCIVVDEKFVLSAPRNLPPETIAPLLCAGITTYSPLKYWNIGKNDKVGVVGLGGLGHIAVKIAKSLGAEVIVFTTSPKKKDDAIKIGADSAVLSTNKTEMLAHINSLDFILDTIALAHDVSTYMALLKPEKTLCMLGLSPTPHQISATDLMIHRKNLSGSLIGGIAETQEMLDHCEKHQITAEIELIPIQKVNEAYERVINGDVVYRFVIDMQSLQT
ncbi:MAG: NAD(P)-dependent alcohol dehydrogenase [Legionellaceae bacterium]|nr:NAD(P)-dependent alcohol dehydrogenase [Legionellaceae bacterium]